MNGTNGLNGTSITAPLQPHGKHIPRRQCIPILYTRGTHYDVGFDVVIYQFSWAVFALSDRLSTDLWFLQCFCFKRFPSMAKISRV